MAMSIDPVCAMAVEPEAGFSVRYRGVEYRFCSTMCREAFTERPGRYLKGGEILRGSGDDPVVEVLDE